ncbi:hypothetical protein MesoLjLc_34430 [Mesorhizobium sp. L-8-10]|nr:hypothetical protein MesoLjLb_35700 [Mesorhizobium sp. L-8-3]BCH31513.1 hypothetical protein MesoLjLc_34430 [Mesorhizobium sp. L-8-10]
MGAARAKNKHKSGKIFVPTSQPCFARRRTHDIAPGAGQGQTDRRLLETKKPDRNDPAKFDWKRLLRQNLQRGTLVGANGRRNAPRR